MSWMTHEDCMRQFESTITLAAEPGAIWQLMSTVVHWPQWMETFAAVEPLDTAELGLARRFKVRQPRLREATWTVTRLEPARGFTWESRAAGLGMVADHWIEPCASGARVQLRFGFAGLLGPFVAVLYGSLVCSYLQLECAAYQRQLQLT
jgi:hypothetical protein